MVAYNFQLRFAPMIRSGRKTQTIRLPRSARSPHARPGEDLQIYTRLRTNQAAKLISDPLCVSVEPVVLLLNGGGIIDGIEIAGRSVAELDVFAARDGFDGISDMSAFFTGHYGLLREFHGVLVRWIPVVDRDGGR